MPSRSIFAISIALSLLGFSAPATLAQAPEPGRVVAQVLRGAPTSHRVLNEKVNENTVTIVSGNPNGTLLYLAYDLSAVLDKKDELRILPVVGKGAHQNVVDVLHLRGVDLGITQTNIIGHLRRTGELGPGIDRRLAYITVLYTSEMHVLAGKGIERVEQLEGKPVNFSDVGSGTQFAVRQIFQLLGLKPQEVNMGQNDAYLKVKSGEIAATVITAGKPVGAFSKFKLEPGMKLLPVPYTKALEQDFFPAVLTGKDYPNLLAADKSIGTVGTGVALVTYNWPRNTERYRRVAKFVESFFDKFDAFRKPPRHPKWRVTNLAATTNALPRFPAAEEWLKRAHAEQASARAAGIDPKLARAQAAQVAPTDAERQKELFRQFLEWKRSKQP